MSNSKYEYILRVFKKYGILAGFDGEIDRTKVPQSKDKENFKAWCLRVLQKDPEEVFIYIPTRLESTSFKRHISTIQREIESETLQCTIKMVRTLERERFLRRNQIEEPHQNANPPTSKSQSLPGVISQKAFLALIESISTDKPDNIKEYLQRIITTHPGSVDLEDILADLMNDFSSHVARLRYIQSEFERLQQTKQTQSE